MWTGLSVSLPNSFFRNWYLSPIYAKLTNKIYFQNVNDTFADSAFLAGNVPLIALTTEATKRVLTGLITEADIWTSTLIKF